MRIDETRHQRGTGGVNAPHVGPVRRIANVTTLAIPVTPHGDDAIALDEHGTNKRRRTQAIRMRAFSISVVTCQLQST